jgi:pyruvate kinase
MFDAIRSLEAVYGRPIGIILDLQGPKLRLGTFAKGAITIEAGHKLRLDLDETPGDDKRIGLPHPEVFASLTPGMTVLLDDGKVSLKVLACGKDFAETEVVAGDELSNHKGLNLPGASLAIAALTEKDREDLAFGLELGIEWVALSFVQRPEDIAEAQELVAGRAGRWAGRSGPWCARSPNGGGCWSGPTVPGTRPCGCSGRRGRATGATSWRRCAPRFSGR